jgi:hypothetical protein
MVSRGEWPGVSQWQLGTDEDCDTLWLAAHRAATDASTSWGAGGVWGFETFAERWGPVERLLHISWLELQAINLAVEHWERDWAGESVCIESDNTAAIAYVNRGGGVVPEGRVIMKEITLKCLRSEIDLRSIHIPGLLNVVPDGLSRNRGKRTTCDYMFIAFARYNAMPHTFDAASDKDGLNRMPGCVDWAAAGPACDFTLHWRRAAGRRIWCNPPFDLVGEFMEAVERAWELDPSTTCTMVVPDWSNLAWHRRALQRRNPVWRLVERLPGSRSWFWRGEAQRRRHPERAAEPFLAPSSRWDVLIVQFP